MRSLRASFFVLVSLVASRGMAAEAVWIGPTTGLWNTAANLSTGVVTPSSNTAVRTEGDPTQNTRAEFGPPVPQLC